MDPRSYLLSLSLSLLYRRNNFLPFSRFAGRRTSTPRSASRRAVCERQAKPANVIRLVGGHGCEVHVGRGDPLVRTRSMYIPRAGREWPVQYMCEYSPRKKTGALLPGLERIQTCSCDEVCTTSPNRFACNHTFLRTSDSRVSFVLVLTSLVIFFFEPLLVMMRDFLSSAKHPRYPGAGLGVGSSCWNVL